MLRVLCPSNKIGSVIGKGGSIISQLREEAGAKIQVEEPVPGWDERVINKNDDEEEAGPVEEVRGGGGGEEDKETASAVQKALFLVVERMFEGDSEEKDGAGEDEGDKDTSFVVRLLVFSSQIGGLLGKAGSVIKQMALESGAQIRILPRDKLPPRASPSDELVQIGSVTGFESVASRLNEGLAKTYQCGARFCSLEGDFLWNVHFQKTLCELCGSVFSENIIPAAAVPLALILDFNFKPQHPARLLFGSTLLSRWSSITATPQRLPPPLLFKPSFRTLSSNHCSQWFKNEGDLYDKNGFLKPSLTDKVRGLLGCFAVLCNNNIEHNGGCNIQATQIFVVKGKVKLLYVTIHSLHENQK
ncbi:unnamed protein product [Coffea canephora]|uniref:K Homology domain-containing protein n=1 Tax=Coffea canephora TaxID=49390 RepID=A0A068U4D6_COFCA|nr:unnamed protein product [Coffea canephora]